MKTLVILSLFFITNNVMAQSKTNYQRLVKIVVDSTQLENFKTALKEGTETGVRLEEGVLLYQIYAKKEYPNHITILETYASIEAYNKHIETPHFKKYKKTVENMVQLLDIVDIENLADVTKNNK